MILIFSQPRCFGLGVGCVQKVSVYSLGDEKDFRMSEIQNLQKSEDWKNATPKQRFDFLAKVRADIRDRRQAEKAEKERLKVLAKQQKSKKKRVVKKLQPIARKQNVTPLPSTPSVTSKSFLESFEWRRLRMEALKKYSPRCMCCGATPKDGAVMNVDHIKPRKLFPNLALDINNLQILCHECNHGKGNWDQTDWRD